MKKAKTLLAVFMLCGALAACGEGSARLTAPGQPRLNGSGNLADSTNGTTTTVSAETVVADSTSLNRGGHGFGSGH